MYSSNSLYPPSYVNDPEILARLQMQGERVQLKRELESLQAMLQGGAGAFSERLLVWHHCFATAIESPRDDFHEIKAQFCTQLQELLRGVSWFEQPICASMVAWLYKHGDLPIEDELVLASKGAGEQPAQPSTDASIPKGAVDNARLAARYKQRRMQGQRQEVQEPARAFQTDGDVSLDMSAMLSQVRAQRFERMAEIAADTNAHMLRVQAEIALVQEQNCDSGPYDAEFCRRAAVLEAGIADFAAERPDLSLELEGQVSAIKGAMDNLGASIAAMSAQAKERFEVSVEEAHKNFSRYEQLHRHLDELADSGNTAISADIAMVMQNILALQEGDLALNEYLNNMQASIGDVQIDMYKDAENLQTGTTYESIQHELELLQAMLDQESQPALESLMSFYRQMREAFAADMLRVETLSMDDQFSELQKRIVHNSLDALEAELSQLERGCEVLQAQIDALPAAIEHIRAMQAELAEGIKSVRKLLKQQKKAMTQGMLKTIALVATAVMTGGSTLALVDLALDVTGMDAKINKLTQKFVQPLSKPLVKVLKPMMAPINEICAPVMQTLAPITQFMGYLNALQGTVSVLNSGGTWQQAGLTLAQNVAPQSGQFARTFLGNPLDLVMREVMKEAAPMLAMVQDVKSVMGFADTLVGSLSALGDAIPVSDSDCMGGFVDDIRRASCPAAEMQRPQQAATGKEEAPRGRVSGQRPALKQNVDTKNHEPSRLKPLAQTAAKAGRPGPAKPEGNVPVARPPLAEKVPVKPLKSAVQQKPTVQAELFRGHGGALCTRGDIMVATNAMNNLDEKYGVGAQIINGFRTDIKWGCAAENIKGPVQAPAPSVKPARSVPATPVKTPAVEMSIYRTAQANLNPLVELSNAAASRGPNCGLGSYAHVVLREFVPTPTAESLYNDALNTAKSRAGPVFAATAGCAVGGSIAAVGGAVLAGGASGGIVAPVGAAVSFPVGCKLGASVATVGYEIYTGANNIKEGYDKAQKIYNALSSHHAACEAQALNLDKKTP
jgi:predicted  nucleic acid-binding Zn-ribbon protein